ncbi:MAG: DUF1109 family protein [Deltaproteobacteria bacterium]|nr:DUF1109 family protein [Deltaproteobacteria bacterium]MBW2383074.1 DUF1109 family protein [Deltaproteobacteria bacterium]MBW2696509.1 DUF1109 family protein [Deltaproteobacteria bacterium]
MSGPAQDLIDALATDLAPIRRIPRVREGLAGVVGIWGVVTLGAAWMREPRLDLSIRLATDGAFAGILLGLALAALAGTIAGLAGAVPGREPLERRARWIGLGGLALALIVGLYASLVAQGAGATAPLGQDAVCLSMGVSIGLAPAAVLLAFARRGHVLRPARDAVLLIVGGFGLGGLAVQIVCHHEGARHMLLGHVMVPPLLLALAAIPLTLWLASRVR